MLNAAYDRGVDLYSIDELCREVEKQVSILYRAHPDYRLRLKAIQGGGGKGQRILQSPSGLAGSLEEQVAAAASDAPGMVREILNEVKSAGVGDNKNVLIELNIETTRHQEIQVVGNGDWCITMGGRDCSLQMHEQKLLEASITIEELQAAIDSAESADQQEQAAALKADLQTLESMEQEAARFGKAVGLDSVSTFECIVDGKNHYFMEMNTRVQVEHRVTELCYRLRFDNPDDDSDGFEVESIIELMVLLARHGERLPMPMRLVRENASVEARLNATNQALQPNAGGMIEFWSNPLSFEIRDDQGICALNPDTGVFVKYHLAGAYDSNIALLLTAGSDRENTYRKMAEVLRRTDLRGRDLASNLDFHYGLVNWFLGQNVQARPTTRFVVPYLTAVGKLKAGADQIDLQYCLAQLLAHYQKISPKEQTAAYTGVLTRKQSLLLRPLEKLFSRPHALAGWISQLRKHHQIGDQGIEWLTNPIRILSDTYHFLDMDFAERKPASQMIWDHDNDLLNQALAFYKALDDRLGTMDFRNLVDLLAAEQHKDFSQEQWQAVRAAHAGFQAGTELLSVLPYLAQETGYYDLKAREDLSIEIPDELLDASLQARMTGGLAPPPMARAGEILADTGGMFYSREAPDMPVYVEEGSHFNEGDPLYIIEVMKMFNKVYAPFAGTIDKVLVDTDGLIIRKGQPLYEVTPDEQVTAVSEADIRSARNERSNAFLTTLI